MIEIATKDSINQVQELSNRVFNHADTEMLKRAHLDPNYKILVSIDNGIVNGYISLLVVDKTAEIIEIATLESVRGRGVGKQLLASAIQELKDLGFEGLLLEVRESNVVARGLYKAFKFKEISTRKNYYDGKENAIVMKLEF